MAKRRAATASTTAESYQHAEATVPLRPEIGTQAQFKKQKPPATYSYDSSLSPQLVWAGKAERLSFDVPTLPLFVHERLSTQAIIQTLTGHRRADTKNAKGEGVFYQDLFADPQHSITDQVLRATSIATAGRTA
jgi:adenine-specific DNA-methyltransferase